VDQLGDLNALSLKGRDIVASQLRITDLSPAGGGFAAFKSDKRTSDAYISFYGPYLEQPQERTSVRLKTANPSWDDEPILLRCLVEDEEILRASRRGLRPSRIDMLLLRQYAV
jgi:hypothetical protein